MKPEPKLYQQGTANKKFGIHANNVILALLSFASLALAIWGINIYRMTMIPVKYLVTIVVIGTSVAFPIIRYGLNPTYNMVWIFFTSMVIGGGTFYFFFLFLNSTYSENEIFKDDFKIISTGTFPKRNYGNQGCGKPFAVIDFHGIEKELVFYCDYEKTISTFAKVRLEYSRGYFGFEVIKTKTLLK